MRPAAAHAVALLAGVAAVGGFSPVDLFPLTLLALAALAHLWIRAGTPRAGFVSGFLFGLGFFLAGVSWVYVSLQRFGGMPVPLAAFATGAFCAFLAFFPALAGWAQAKLPGPGPRLAAIPALWTLAEWLRGSILTGFPWLPAGNAALDSPLAGFAPLGGAYLLSFLTMGAAVLLWMLAAHHRRWFAAGAFAALGAAGAGLQTVEWTAPAGPPVSVSLLQGNVPQSLKFEPGRYERTLETYGRLADASRARLIVLPETALPRFLDLVDPAYLARLRAVAERNGGDLLLGVPRRTGPDTYLNSVVTLGVSPRGAYDKVHLVPFGEFVPPGFGWVLSVLRIPLSDFARGAPDQAPLAAAGERVAVNVCYEDAFGAEIAARVKDATLLVNVSNVAWFGDSLAPGQHLQIARLRALETGRDYLTATNTGVTAVVGAHGRVRARLPQFAEGRLDAEAQGRTGVTPYVRFGDLPVLLLALAVLALVALRSRSR